MTGELSPASVYVRLLQVVEACVVVAVPGRVGEVRVAADEPSIKYRSDHRMFGFWFGSIQLIERDCTDWQWPR